MQTPLRYQVTEFDCGPTALLNAISYLFPSEEIPVEFVQTIYRLSLDDMSEDGRPGWKGTSPAALYHISDWLNLYRDRTGYPLRTTFYRGADVNYGEDSPILRCIQDGGTAVVKCLLGGEHYVTLTGMDEQGVHVFDPYDWDVEYGEGVACITDQPLAMNRRISLAALAREDGSSHYSQCRVQTRAAVLFSKEGKGPEFEPGV